MKFMQLIVSTCEEEVTSKIKETRAMKPKKRPWTLDLRTWDGNSLLYNYADVRLLTNGNAAKKNGLACQPMLH